jgi:hypothetical protein
MNSDDDTASRQCRRQKRANLLGRDAEIKEGHPVMSFHVMRGTHALSPVRVLDSAHVSPPPV